MKISKLMIFIILVILSSSCSRISRNHDKLDIKEIITSKGVAFDIRVIKDVYGIPPIVDVSKSTIGYYNIYEEYSGFFIWEEPERSEIWYLLLQPTKDENYYVGKRFVASFGTTFGKNPKFTHGTPKTKIEEIMRYKEVSNDPFNPNSTTSEVKVEKQKTKPTNKSNLKSNSKKPFNHSR